MEAMFLFYLKYNGSNDIAVYVLVIIYHVSGAKQHALFQN